MAITDEFREETINMFREYLTTIEEGTKFDILKEMKGILNISFGEQNNQILKPEIEDLVKYLNENATSSDELAYHINKPKFNQKMARWNGQYSIIVFFPEIVITNSKNIQHTIRKLYVRIRVGKDGLLSGSLDGVRTCVTEVELNKRYFHSHLHGFNPTNIQFTRFCLGSGEINLAMSMLRSQYDKINFTLFCLHLKNYVKWESIEGTPYNYIANIETREVAFNEIMGDVSGASLTSIVEVLYKQIISIPLAEKRNLFNYSISEKGLIVTPTEELERLLAIMIQGVRPDIISRGITNLNWMLVTKNTAGDYCRLNAANAGRIVTQKTPVLTFKGEPKMFNVVEIKEVKKIEKYANPRITETLCWRLSCDFTKEAIKHGSNSWKANSTGSEHEVTNPNPLSVF
jgi:hypothetical protein